MLPFLYYNFLNGTEFALLVGHMWAKKEVSTNTLKNSGTEGMTYLYFEERQP